MKRIGLLVIWIGLVCATAFPSYAQSPPDQWPLLPSCLDHSQPKACTDSTLQDHFARFIQWPEQDSVLASNSKVLIEFTIDSLGMLTDARVLRGTVEMGAEALRVLHLLPKWIPAATAGHPTSITLRLPVAFRDPNPLRGYSIQWGPNNSTTLSSEDLSSMKKELVHIATPDGHRFTPTGIRLMYRKGQKERLMESPPKLQKEAWRWLDRCAVGGTLELTVRWAQGTDFEEISRVWTIVSNKNNK